MGSGKEGGRERGDGRGRGGGKERERKWEKGRDRRVEGGRKEEIGDGRGERGRRKDTEKCMMNNEDCTHIQKTDSVLDINDLPQFSLSTDGAPILQAMQVSFQNCLCSEVGGWGEGALDTWMQERTHMQSCMKETPCYHAGKRNCLCNGVGVGVGRRSSRDMDAGRNTQCSVQ